jgi:hypothetical protein
MDRTKINAAIYTKSKILLNFLNMDNKIFALVSHVRSCARCTRISLINNIERTKTSAAIYRAIVGIPPNEWLTTSIFFKGGRRFSRRLRQLIKSTLSVKSINSPTSFRQTIFSKISVNSVIQL